MSWFRLAFHGLRRRPLRTAVTIAGVAIAIAACFSLLAFQAGYRRSLALELDRLGAHILVVPKGCPYDAASLALHGANWPCHLKASYLEEVRGTTGVADAAPVFMAAFYEPSGVHTVYVGIETNMLHLKRSWRITGAFPDAPGTILVGAGAARRRGWNLDQRVTLPSLEPHERLVTGLLSPMEGPDDRFIFLPLEDAQRLFKHTNELTHILVRLKDPGQMDQVVAALRGCDAGMQMNVVPLEHLFHTIQSMVASTRWFLGCVTLVGLLAAASGVSATLLIAVAERSREIGVMRGLGASRLDVFRLFWIETVQTCLAGAAAGVVVAWLCMGGIESWLRTRLPFVPDARLLEWDWWNVASCFAIALVLGSVAGLAPAGRAAALPPVLAMRSHGGSA